MKPAETASLRIDYVDPNELKPNPWNTNVVSPGNEQKLHASVDRLGMFKPALARTLPNGQIEILGGEHRWQYAIAKGESKFPIINLGQIDDHRAKEISLVDNGRYGVDDTVSLAALLAELGPIDDLASFMPFEAKDIDSMFSSVNIALDDLELSDEEQKAPVLPPSRKVQEFQVMRFKVPVADAAMVTDKMNTIMKQQGFTNDDSLTNAGFALVHLCSQE
jgi:ParB-like chromosome segregation protein Spo0J